MYHFSLLLQALSPRTLGQVPQPESPWCLSLSSGYVICLSSWSVGLVAPETGAWTLFQLCVGRNQQMTVSPVDMLMRPVRLQSDPLFWTSADICLLLFVVACIGQIP